MDEVVVKYINRMHWKKTAENVLRMRGSRSMEGGMRKVIWLVLMFILSSTQVLEVDGRVVGEHLLARLPIEGLGMRHELSNVSGPTRGVGMGVLTTAPTQSSITPPSPAPADYFRDVANHPDVLATILNSVREDVNYDPSTLTTGPSDNEHKVTLLEESFTAFITGLDAYSPYVVFSSHSDEHPNESTVLEKVVGSVVSKLNVGFNNSVSKHVLRTITRSVFYLTGHDSSEAASNSSFGAVLQMVALPASTAGEVKESSYNPSVIFWSSHLTISPNTSCNRSTPVILHRSTFTSYRLLTSTIQVYADYLAGSTITTVDELYKILNARPPIKKSPRDEFELSST